MTYGEPEAKTYLSEANAGGVHEADGTAFKSSTEGRRVELPEQSGPRTQELYGEGRY